MLGRKTGGRQRGTPNHTTAAMRTVIVEALEKAGGVDYLVRVAHEDPAIFLRLLARLLPSQVASESQGTSWQEILEDVRLRRVDRLGAAQGGAEPPPASVTDPQAGPGLAARAAADSG